MKVTLKIKLKEYETVVIEDVKFYSYEKQYLTIVLESGKKEAYRLTTVMSIKES